MPESRGRVIVVGVATRALALSAARAGYEVTAIDAFGDLDLRAATAVTALRRDEGSPYSAMAAARAAGLVDAWAVAYTSNFENHPEAVALLAKGRLLLGNRPQVLEQIRNPLTLMRALRRRGFAVPATRASAPPSSTGRWLRKPRRSGGGHGTAVWRSGAVPRSAYLQAHLGGVPGSITFLADGRHALPLGISRQLVGDAAFGSHGFRYCGSLLAGGKHPLFNRPDDIAATARALAEAVTRDFGLVGLNGLDFVAHDGVPYPIEVNPRYSASMELVERSTSASLFELHARACAGSLPAEVPASDTVAGKAVVFARRPFKVGDTRRWPSRGMADIPHPGERIGRGHPICTVFAEGRDADECRRQLLREANRIYRAVESPARGAA
ncbi:MAG: ATP-grasp domain-containing protein [Gemmatimonadales bacterium]